MAKEIRLQIVSEQADVIITMTVTAGYSPDILDDLKRRTLETYADALALRMPNLDVVEEEQADE
jgi:hypothetical protein